MHKKCEKTKKKGNKSMWKNVYIKKNTKTQKGYKKQKKRETKRYKKYEKTKRMWEICETTKKM